MENKRDEEQRQVDGFLNYYNVETGLNYEIKCRPEDKSDQLGRYVNGTYDFLLVESNARDLDIAVELGEICMSQTDRWEGARHVEFLRALRTELARHIEPGKRFVYSLDFSRPPLREEFEECKSTVSGWLRTTIANWKQGANVRLASKGTLNGNLQIEYNLVAVNEGNRGVVFLSNRDGGVGQLISDEVSNNAFLEVILGNDKKLAIPKEEGKKTILLAVNSREGNSFPEPRAMKLMVQDSPHIHNNIHEIYLLNRKILSDEFEIDRIK